MGRLVFKAAQQRQPFGGHHFPQPTPSGPMTIKAATFAKTVEAIAQYRINNHIPVDDPKEELIAYYAKNWPWMVMNDDSTGEPPAKNPHFLVWRDWIHKLWTSPPQKLINRKEAPARWAICETCPHNKPITWEDTKEGHALHKRTFLYRRGEWVPKFIQFCACHGADLGTLSFLEDPMNHSSRKKTDPSPPKECWVKPI